MESRKLFLARHGETPQSRESIVQGQSNTHLTPKGESDSLALGDYLAQTQNVQMIITSDLWRAVMTAKLVARRIRTQPIIVEESALRELACGVLEGQPFPLLQAGRNSDPKGLEHFAPAGGESLAEMRRRVTDWFLDFVIAAPSEALIVTHKGPLAAILATIAPSMPLETRQLALDHCSLISLTLDKNGAAKFVEVVRRPYG